MYNPFNRKKKQEHPAAQLAMEVDGHKLYIFENFQSMSKLREVAIRKTYHELELGIKVVDLDVYLDMITEAIDAGSMSQIAALTEHFKGYRNQYVSERIIMSLGGWGILINDEPWLEPREEDNKLKSDLLKKHKEVRAFFLSSALGYLGDLANQIESSSIQEYLKDPKNLIRERMFLKSMQIGTYESLWTE